VYTLLQSAGRFESCGWQPIMLKITAWPVRPGGRWICELRRQPRKRLRHDLGLSFGPDSLHAAPVIVADGIVLGGDHGGGQHWRKVAAVKRSCKPAATFQGFPTPTQH
jgi:hypothetical protein